MADLQPFAGVRYDPGRIALSEVIAPPYDVVDAAGHARLEAQSPYNAVRLEISRDEPGRDRYEAARCRMEEWLADGVLRTDASPAFYLYRMGFTSAGGRPRQTTGVLGALALDAGGEGSVLPHERTMGKPLGDRLRLLRACRTNVSPIWVLSLAPGLTSACEPAGPPVARATDADGVHHRLWSVTSPAQVEAISATVASAPVVIADGHHRYETALAYRAERRDANGGRPGDYDQVLAYVVELADHELDVRAIHRVVSGLPDAGALMASLRLDFDLEEVGPDRNWSRGGEAGAPEVVLAGSRYRLHPRADTSDPGGGAADTERIEAALARLPAHRVDHHPSAEEAVARVRAGQAQAALLVRPVGVPRLTEVARAGGRLPEKTTYFHPKPVTGMVFRRLAD